MEITMRTQFRLMILSAMLLTCLPVIQPLAAAPIDEFRLTDIEQKIRTLESTVREQARQITELQRQPGLPQATLNTPVIDSAPRWLTSANWTRIKPGMNELQVIELLGPPTQQRVGNDPSRTLLYAMEIGRSGFLSGRVTLVDRKVTVVEIPSLK
jgi:hypothetical protein